MSNGIMFFLNAIKSDIQKAELKEQGKALLELSNTDSLTGLANRRPIDRRLRELFEDWRSGGNAFRHRTDRYRSLQALQ